MSSWNWTAFFDDKAEGEWFCGGITDPFVEPPVPENEGREKGFWRGTLEEFSESANDASGPSEGPFCGGVPPIKSIIFSSAPFEEVSSFSILLCFASCLVSHLFAIALWTSQRQ